MAPVGDCAWEERAQLLQQPVLEGGCLGLRIRFAEEVEMLLRLCDPWLTKTQWCKASGTGGLRSAVWRRRHWRATVGWSTPAEVFNILVFPFGCARRPHKHGIGFLS